MLIRFEPDDGGRDVIVWDRSLLPPHMNICSSMAKLWWWITRSNCGFDTMQDMYEEEDYNEDEMEE